MSWRQVCPGVEAVVSSVETRILCVIRPHGFHHRFARAHLRDSEVRAEPERGTREVSVAVDRRFARMWALTTWTWTMFGPIAPVFVKLRTRKTCAEPPPARDLSKMAPGKYRSQIEFQALGARSPTYHRTTSSPATAQCLPLTRVPCECASRPTVNKPNELLTVLGPVPVRPQPRERQREPNTEARRRNRHKSRRLTKSDTSFPKTCDYVIARLASMPCVARPS